jgi:hypothetical protein
MTTQMPSGQASPGAAMHPGLTSPRLADMRMVLDEVMSDRERRAVESALSDVETEWKGKKKESYEQGVAERDRLHTEVLDVAGQFIDQIAEARDDVRNGRRSGREMRAWLRDARADFDKLVEQHRGILASEASLAAQESQDAAAYQDQFFARFPRLASSAPTLASRVREILSRPRRPATTPYQTREELDRAQDELVRELRRFPALGQR